MKQLDANKIGAEETLRSNVQELDQNITKAVKGFNMDLDKVLDTKVVEDARNFDERHAEQYLYNKTNGAEERYEGKVSESGLKYQLQVAKEHNAFKDLRDCEKGAASQLGNLKSFANGLLVAKQETAKDVTSMLGAAQELSWLFI